METDKNKADLLLVVGTTLAVAGVTQLLQLLPHTIPQVRHRLNSGVVSLGVVVGGREERE